MLWRIHLAWLLRILLDNGRSVFPLTFGENLVVVLRLLESQLLIKQVLTLDGESSSFGRASAARVLAFSLFLIFRLRIRDGFSLFLLLFWLLDSFFLLLLFWLDLGARFLLAWFLFLGIKWLDLFLFFGRGALLLDLLDLRQLALLFLGLLLECFLGFYFRLHLRGLYLELFLWLLCLRNTWRLRLLNLCFRLLNCVFRHVYDLLRALLNLLFDLFSNLSAGGSLLFLDRLLLDWFCRCCLRWRLLLLDRLCR